MSVEINSTPVPLALNRGYVDLFLSKELSSKILSVSSNFSIALAMLYIFKADYFLAVKAAEHIGIMNFKLWYWGIYASAALLVVCVNFSTLKQHSYRYQLKREDWNGLINQIFQVREFLDLSDLKSGRRIQKATPVYVVFLGVFICLFGEVLSFNTLFFNPISQMLQIGGEIDFAFSFSTLLSGFMFTYFTPYIYLLVAIYIKHS